MLEEPEGGATVNDNYYEEYWKLLPLIVGSQLVGTFRVLPFDGVLNHDDGDVHVTNVHWSLIIANIDSVVHVWIMQPPLSLIVSTECP